MKYFVLIISLLITNISKAESSVDSGTFKIAFTLVEGAIVLTSGLIAQNPDESGEVITAISPIFIDEGVGSVGYVALWGQYNKRELSKSEKYSKTDVLIQNVAIVNVGILMLGIQSHLLNKIEKKPKNIEPPVVLFDNKKIMIAFNHKY